MLMLTVSVISDIPLVTGGDDARLSKSINSYAIIEPCRKSVLIYNKTALHLFGHTCLPACTVCAKYSRIPIH